MHQLATLFEAHSYALAAIAACSCVALFGTILHDFSRAAGTTIKHLDLGEWFACFLQAVSCAAICTLAAAWAFDAAGV